MNDSYKSLIETVKFNCDVSDAKYWGFYSICGLLMSLRALYISNKGLKPWEHIDQSDISEWINKKDKANLGLCIALLDRYKAKLHLPIRNAFEGSIQYGDWSPVDEARKEVCVGFFLLRNIICE